MAPADAGRPRCVVRVYERASRGFPESTITCVGPFDAPQDAVKAIEGAGWIRWHSDPNWLECAWAGARQRQLRAELLALERDVMRG